MLNGQYVQYGCGMSAPKSWKNFDASPTLRFERVAILGRFHTKNKTRFPDNIAYGDIIKGLPINDNSCRAIYCSHVLEHLALEDFRVALSNTYRILEDGGVFRFVLPDLEYYVRQYVEDTSRNAALNFMRETYLGIENRNRGFKSLIRSFFGNSQHLWMWDYKSIEQELMDAGFSNVRRACFGDNDDSRFRDVEDKGRWGNCLGVECTKPIS